MPHNRDRNLEMLEQMEHAESMLETACARALLAKLNVAELRVLYCHYFPKRAPGIEKELRKADLLDDIVPEYIDRNY